MAWCHQASSHYLGQGWSSFMMQYDITRVQWVKSLWPCVALLHWGSLSTMFQVWLVAWLYQTITWTNAVLPSTRSSCIHPRVIFMIWIPKFWLKFTHWKLCNIPPGANGLRTFALCIMIIGLVKYVNIPLIVVLQLDDFVATKILSVLCYDNID